MSGSGIIEAVSASWLWPKLLKHFLTKNLKIMAYRKRGRKSFKKHGRKRGGKRLGTYTMARGGIRL